MAGIYFHIPFCKTRCAYCDFYSTTLSSLRDCFVQSACKELELRRDYLKEEPIRTLYFGGGTPSQLTVTELEKLLDTVDRQYNLSTIQEITMEVNPDDLTGEYLLQLRRLPINRISMGVQSFHNSLLQFIGRRHTAEQAIEAVKRCQDSGLENISIDLIYGFPEETLAFWEDDLDSAIELQVKHLSAYHLTYEKGTRLGELKEKGEIRPVSEDISLSSFQMLREKLLAAGFEHYEISNFCQPGYHSRHNSAYWSGGKYIGIGPGAHSFNGESRQWNDRNLKKYIEATAHGVVPFEKEILTPNDCYNEYILTRLRTSKGLSLESLKKQFGYKRYTSCLLSAKSYLNADELEITDDHYLKLTPRGIFVSDGIICDLMIVED